MEDGGLVHSQACALLSCRVGEPARRLPPLPARSRGALPWLAKMTAKAAKGSQPWDATGVCELRELGAAPRVSAGCPVLAECRGWLLCQRDSAGATAAHQAPTSSASSAALVRSRTLTPSALRASTLGVGTACRMQACRLQNTHSLQRPLPLDQYAPKHQRCPLKLFTEGVLSTVAEHGGKIKTQLKRATRLPG